MLLIYIFRAIFLLFAILVQLAFSSDTSTKKTVTVTIKTSDSAVGVYFPGDLDPQHPVFKDSYIEHLLEVVPPKSVIREDVNFGTALVIRGSDLKTRVRINFEQSEDINRPYSISFFNLANGDRGSGDAIELKHSDSGYIWIDGGMVIQHDTDENHEFTIRDGLNKDVFSVVLNPSVSDEL